MKLIIGLGNPGLAYKGTRHNLGFAVVENIAGRNGARLRKKSNHSAWAEIRWDAERVILACPATFMNRSGLSVYSWLKKESADLEDVLIVCDDINLPFGNLRLRGEGSAGGHKGLASVIEHLGSNEFARLKVGIGPAGTEAVNEGLKDFVLNRFNRRERSLLPALIVRAAEACECWLKEGLQSAMNKFNTRVMKGE